MSNPQDIQKKPQMQKFVVRFSLLNDPSIWRHCHFLAVLCIVLQC